MLAVSGIRHLPHEVRPEPFPAPGAKGCKGVHRQPGRTWFGAELSSSLAAVPNEWYVIWYKNFGDDAMAITASEARKKLFPLIEQVNDDRQPVEITSKRGEAVLLSKADYDALTETASLLRVPANARCLLESLEQARRGQRQEHGLG